VGGVGLGLRDPTGRDRHAPSAPRASLRRLRRGERRRVSTARADGPPGRRRRARLAGDRGARDRSLGLGRRRPRHRRRMAHHLLHHGGDRLEEGDEPCADDGEGAWLITFFTMAAKKVMSQDRKSTRLNSSHGKKSYAVLRLKKKR